MNQIEGKRQSWDSNQKNVLPHRDLNRGPLKPKASLLSMNNAKEQIDKPLFLL